MSPGPKGDGGRPDADQEITTVEGRGGYIVFPKGSMHVVLLSALANGQALSYPALSNTLHVERSEQIESGVTTLPAVGVGTLDLKVRYTGTGIIPAGHFSIDVKDANSGVLLQRVKTVGDVGDTLMALHVPLNYPGREVTVGLTLSNMEAATGLTLERWYLPWEGGPSQLTGLPIARQSELPTSIALHQNYPNPFNPTTEIRFDLPDAGNVSLVVYDVLGRKVAELANGYQAAGYHAATWNAAGAASGVYFARFSVTSAEGAVAYTKINKLVLMK